MQLVLVLLCLGIAVTYAAYRIYSVFQKRRNPCVFCEGCAYKGVEKRNMGCKMKKEDEKFGDKRKKH